SPLSPHSRTAPPEGEHLKKALRLGLRQIRGFKEDEAKALMTARANGASTLHAFARVLSQRSMEQLAEADAFRSLGLARREALWAVKGLSGEAKAPKEAPLLTQLPLFEDEAALPSMSLPEHVAEDYRTTSLSLKAHPLQFFRPSLTRRGVTPAAQLGRMKNGARITVAGLVLIRQQPQTANGIVFMTLEDETGPANVVVWQDRFQANRKTVMMASFLMVHGRLQKADGVIHVVAERFTDLSAQLARLREEPRAPAPSQEVKGRLIRSRDFH
ncbi:MAG: OB-fold nucleic acid binding domain-containing protein, partial [Parcubacteria group bacterium]